MGAWNFSSSSFFHFQHVSHSSLLEPNKVTLSSWASCKEKGKLNISFFLLLPVIMCIFVRGERERECVCDVVITHTQDKERRRSKQTNRRKKHLPSAGKFHIFSQEEEERKWEKWIYFFVVSRRKKRLAKKSSSFFLLLSDILLYFQTIRRLDSGGITVLVSVSESRTDRKQKDFFFFFFFFSKMISVQCQSTSFLSFGECV